MVNKVLLIGNLGADPEVRTLENGAMVAKLRVATNENYRDRNGEWQTQTEWHDVVVWRALAERAQEYLKKGAQIYLEGKLTHRMWEDQNGNKRKSTEVVGNYFRMIGARRDGSSTGSNYFPSEEPAPTSATPPPKSDSAAPAPAETSASATDGDDDLPF
ncbi:MAG: single-stranded DNA-binding protein [Bacteroidota bacterium]